MIAVKAPEGYEGVRYWVDGAREWMASARPVGATWWHNVGYVGHRHIIASELDARATAAIERAVKLGSLRGGS